MQIRRAQPTEAAELTEIAHAAKRFWGYPESWIQRWRDALSLSPEQVVRLGTYVALEQGSVIGFYALECRPGVATLEHLWVRPGWIGRGVGRALFRHAAEQASWRGADVLEIESDPNAEAFYRRMGAQRIGSVAAPAGERADRVLPRMQLRLASAGTLRGAS